LVRLVPHAQAHVPHPTLLFLFDYNHAGCYGLGLHAQLAHDHRLGGLGVDAHEPRLLAPIEPHALHPFHYKRLAGL
jgi:hypothetical protein